MATSLKAIGEPLLVILGATGVGKSKLAIQLAQKFHGEIVGADAVQLYKGLDIVTNKVTESEKTLVRHHMIDFLDPLTPRYLIHQYRNDALKAIDDIVSRKKLPIIVGGTNYYIEALLWEMLVEAPQERAFTDDIDEYLNSLKSEELYSELCQIDSQSARKLHPNDTRKVYRALQVYYQHRRPLSDMLDEQHSKSGSSFRGTLRFPKSCFLWIQCDKEALERRLDARVDSMLAAGMLNELSQFHAHYSQQCKLHHQEIDYQLGVFQSIGFKEFRDHLTLSDEERATAAADGNQLVEKAIEEMKCATRQYSRRQIKWIQNRFLRRDFERNPPVYGLDGTELNEWETDVVDKAVRIVDAFLKDEPVPQKRLAQVNASEQLYGQFRCETCSQEFVSHQQHQEHLASRRHKKRVQSERRRQATSTGDPAKRSTFREFQLSIENDESQSSTSDSEQH